jgi:hypothetical protein
MFILTIGIKVKRLKKQLRKAKTRTTPEYSDAEDMEIECNTLESNSNKSIRLNLVTNFNKCKIYFQVSVVILFEKIHFKVKKKTSKVNVTFQNLTREFDLMVTNFSTSNLSFLHFVDIFQNVHLIPKEKCRKVSIGQILMKTLNVLANLASTIFKIYSKLV